MHKIRWKPLWFVLLALPLLFTPVSLSHKGSDYYEGLTLGPQLALPLGGMLVIRWDKSASPVQPWSWSWGKYFSFYPHDSIEPSRLYVDWGRICYWWAWVIAVAVVFNWRRISPRRVLSPSDN